MILKDEIQNSCSMKPLRTLSPCKIPGQKDPVIERQRKTLYAEFNLNNDNNFRITIPFKLARITYNMERALNKLVHFTTYLVMMLQS